MVSPPPNARWLLQRRRLFGQRGGIVIFMAIFAGATLVWTIQILTAVWGTAPPSPPGGAGGTASLERPVERARLAYAIQAGDEDESAALARYRSALEPEWQARKNVEAVPDGDAGGAKRRQN